MSEETWRLPLDLADRRRSPIFGDARLARLPGYGDQRAFATIYRRHHQELYRYCRAILRDPDEAQDALQNTMVKALRSLPGQDREVALKPWLFRVAHNECVDLLRARKRTSELDPELADHHSEVEQVFATHDRLRELVRDLDQLPQRQRATLVMRELSGLSFAQIGLTFGVGPAAAKQSVYEARIALQEMSEGRQMECDRVRSAISEHDGRVLRGRRIRAHLRECEGCRGFAEAIEARRADLTALAPPLAVPAALATLHAALGAGASTTSAASVAGGAAAAGGLGGGIGAGVGVGAAAKAAVAVIATATVVGGAAQLTGAIDIGGSDGPARPSVQSQPPASSSGSNGETAPAAIVPPPTGADVRHSGARSRRSANGTSPRPGRSGDSGRGHRPASGANGQSGSVPGQSGTPGNSPPTPPGQSQSPPGQSGSTAPSASSTGQAHSGAGSSASAGSSSQSGGTATAPGQAGGSPGQSASAPGQSRAAPGSTGGVHGDE